MKPSIKTLEAAFPGKGKLLRTIIETPTPYLLLSDEYPLTTSWVAACYIRPQKHDLRMALINETIEGHGVEAIFPRRKDEGPDFEYVNMGDTYNTTIAFDFTKHRFIVTTMGDWIEAQERKGIRYD